MAFTQKLKLTNSTNNLFLFVYIFIIFSFINLTNAQKFSSKNSDLEYTNNNNINTVKIQDKSYSDFIEDNISIKDELIVTSKNYTRIHGKFTPITANVKELYKFFRVLKGSRSQKIRIAHYGDSILLGDVISENLREKFQQKFGGDGIGLLSIVPDDIRMKRSISQKVSTDWQRGSLSKGNPKRFPIGISGLTAKANFNSWIKLKTTKFMKTSRSFKSARIFYSNATSSSSIEYSLGRNKFKLAKLKSGNKINQIILTSPSNVMSLEIKFKRAKGTYFYGISLENGNGVYLDNFALTGNSGVSLTKIKKQTIKDFNKLLNYKLVIIQFGVNASEPGMNLRWYINKMVKVIKNFKKSIPDVSVLLVSAGDKSIKRGSRLITDPTIIKLIKAQKEIAKKANVAFWNLHEAMGGSNSMPKWVNAGPPLGLKDYIHFTNLGGKVVADLLFQALMKEYNKMR